MAGWDYEQISPPLNDTRVDQFTNQPQGVIDKVPSLDLDLPDAVIIKNLNGRINDSQEYWDKPEGFNLHEARQENKRLHMGRQIDVSHLYRFQVPYVENEIFVGVESIVGYVTAQQPLPEAYPAQDTQRARIFASDLEKALIAHSQKFNLAKILEYCIRNWMLKRSAAIHLYFDKNHGKHGEIIPIAVDPEHLIIDKNAAAGQNPEFICHVLKRTPSKLIEEYPEKEEEILKALGIVRKGPKNMEQTIAVRRVWVTHWKDGKAVEGCVTYFGNLVLGKYKNPNWRYSGDNFLDVPMKPYIFLSVINDGNHIIDITTPVEQAANMQNILNKRGRQVMELADKAVGMLVISTDSGLSKDDAQNLTGDPNQKLVITTKGQPVNNLVYQVPPPEIEPALFEDKQDIRATIHNILGTPPQFTGAQNKGDNTDTLGEALMIKNQAQGRQDLIVRAIDNFMDQYFKFLVQMMAVWYDEKHFFVYNGGDGEFDYITIHRDLIDSGMQVTVKSGSTLPFDKGRQEAVALNLAKIGVISPLDLYKDLHMDRPQQRYDNFAKWKADPMSLARDAHDIDEESSAYVDYIEIIEGGEDVKPHEDAGHAHILTHRKQMITDEFLKAPSTNKRKFIKHLMAEMKGLELRTAMDMMAAQDSADAGALPEGVPMPANPAQPGVMPPQPAPMGAPAPGGPMPMNNPQGLPNPNMPQSPQLSNPSALPIV